jgi:hypothetical protein
MYNFDNDFLQGRQEESRVGLEGREWKGKKLEGKGKERSGWS